MLLHIPYPLEALIVFGALGLVLVGSLVGVFAWERARKLQIVEKALYSGLVDAATKKELLQRLLRQRRAALLPRLGWVGILGGAVLLFTEPSIVGLYEDTARWLALNLIVFGVGAVAVPFVARELRIRRLQIEEEL